MVREVDPASEQTRVVSVTPAQRYHLGLALMELMALVNEECFGRPWMVDCEAGIWLALESDTNCWGMCPLGELGPMLRTLRDLSGYWVYPSEAGPVLVPAEDFWEMLGRGGTLSWN